MLIIVRCYIMKLLMVKKDTNVKDVNIIIINLKLILMVLIHVLIHVLLIILLNLLVIY